MPGTDNLTVFPGPPQTRSRPRGERPRLLVFIVAYHAESTIGQVLSRIPASLHEDYDAEVLIIDDGSADGTFERGLQLGRGGEIAFPLTVLANPVNQGYGGNQKIGYHYAIKNGFDYVALLHGDGQYAPECLPGLVDALRTGGADACFGSRMMAKGDAIRGGMPLYKFVGNRILSWLENWMLRTEFTEFHSGYRVYSVPSLRRIPFDLNTSDFHFDTEIIIQFVRAGFKIIEMPIPTYYGDEICRVNGLKYAWNVVCAVTKARAQDLSLFYDRRFDCASSRSSNDQYVAKLDFDSPHAVAFGLVAPKSRVLDLGCAGGYVGMELRQKKQCEVVGVDVHALPEGASLDEFHQHDLNRGPPKLSRQFDYVLLLDVIEHMASPEEFVERLHDAVKMAPDTRLIVSTGNIGFLIVRLMLLIGQFNYGKKGILDLTHTRLFSFASLRRLFEQGGFRVIECRGIPAPFPLALGASGAGRLLLRLNRLLIAVSKGLFSYQMLFVLKPNPSLEYMLEAAETHSTSRARDLSTSAG
jgi:glycosyltransferase involved in cell wall biosynthesis